MPEFHQIQIHRISSIGIKTEQNIFLKIQNKTNTKEAYKWILLEPRLRITNLVEAQEMIHTKMSILYGLN